MALKDIGLVDVPETLIQRETAQAFWQMRRVPVTSALPIIAQVPSNDRSAVMAIALLASSTFS